MNSSLNRTAFYSPLSRWRAVLAAGILGLTLAACGGGDGDTVAPAGNNATVGVTENTLSVSLTAGGVVSASGVSTKAVGDNLVNLDRVWPNWSGQSTGITYDAANAVLRIPGDDSDLVLGVQRYNTPLTAGTTYTLQANASNAEAAAVLFLFDTSGGIIPVPGNTGLIIAKTGSSVVFTAPANVAGFYLQVQNRYRATDQVTLTAGLIEGEVSGGNTFGPNLIDIQGPWPDWTGNPTGVNGDESTIGLAEPSTDVGIIFGVKRFNKPLRAGIEYDLESVFLSDFNHASSVLLFLFDDDGSLIPFADNSGSISWIAVAPSMSRRFTAPANVAGFAIQVQHPYFQGMGTTVIAPRFREVTSQSALPPMTGNGAVSIVRTSDDGGFILYGDDIRQWFDNACVQSLGSAGIQVPTVSWDQIKLIRQVPGVAVCLDVIAAVGGQPAQMGSFLSCTTTIRGGRDGISVTSVSRQFAVVRNTSGALVYERGVVDSGQVSSTPLIDIVGTVPQPRASFSEGPNGLTTWTFSNGGFNAATGEVVFGRNESVTFDRRTGSVQSYNFSDGPATTGLATLTTVNCIPSDTVSVVRTANDGGHILYGDGTRQWFDRACFQSLVGAGVSVPTVPWDDIKQMTQVPGVAVCAQVIDAVGSQPPSQGTQLSCTDHDGTVSNVRVQGGADLLIDGERPAYLQN